jgi:hypothetical protein
MPTSISPTVPGGPTSRPRVRLSLAPALGRDHLDGGWWPRSRDLAVELADLVDQFPPEVGRIMRALYSPPDWEPAPRRIGVAGGWLTVGSFPRGDTHVIDLYTFDRTTIRLLVVPPGFTAGQGAESLLAAATPGNAHSGGDVLELVTDQADVDPADLWRADGGTWWASDAEARPTRTEKRPWHT